MGKGNLGAFHYYFEQVIGNLNELSFIDRHIDMIDNFAFVFRPLRDLESLSLIYTSITSS